MHVNNYPLWDKTGLMTFCVYRNKHHLEAIPPQRFFLTSNQVLILDLKGKHS